jgi:hypothetical protein
MQLFTNNASSVLATGISAAATSLVVSAGTGARFPNPSGGDYFLLTLFQMSGSTEVNHEIVKCTSRTTDTLVIARAQEGTTARAFNAADPVSLRATAGSFTPGAIGAVSAVTATAPVVSSGGLTPVISMPAATAAVDGYLTATAYSLFSGKQNALGYSPVQQGTGPNQLSNAIKIGWGGPGNTKLLLAVDTTDYGSTWPIAVTGTALNVTGTVAIANGGTGATTASAALTALGAYPATNPNSYITASGAPVQSVGGFTGAVTKAQLALDLVENKSSATIRGELTAANVNAALGATAIAVANGGTGLTSYAVGDILYASASGTISKLADAATGNVLLSGGVGVAPAYGKVGMSTHVSGVLPIANGGTNSTAAPAAGGVAYGTGTAVAYTPAGSAGQFLKSNGAGAPSFAALTTTDITGLLNGQTLAGPLNGESHNRYFNNGNTAASPAGVYMLLATLPATTVGSMDCVILDVVVGGWESINKAFLQIYAANRGGFSYWWNVVGNNFGVRGVRAYQQSDGTVQLWGFCDASTYTTFNASIRLNTGATVASSGTTTVAPTGSIVFDSSIPATYKPLTSTDANGSTVIGTVTAKASDSGRAFQTLNTTASGEPAQFYVDHAQGNVTIGNARGTLQMNGNASTATTATTATTTTGNAGTATKLQTARGINGVLFDGSAAILVGQLNGNNYISGGLEKPNWFGAGVLRNQMLSSSNLGTGVGTWNDVLWVNSYTGGDVKGTTALILSKDSDYIGFARQNYDATAWGTVRQIWHSGNMNAPAVSAVPNSTVQRDGGGYLQGTYVNLSDEGTSGTAGAVTGIITKRGDNYYRTTDAGSVRTYLGLASVATSGDYNSLSNRPPAVVSSDSSSIQWTAADLNTLKSSGFYRGSNMGNAPDATGWWYVIVEAHDPSWVKQTATAYASGGSAVAGATYMRMLVSGNWTAWKQVYTAFEPLNKPTIKGYVEQIQSYSGTAFTLNPDLGTFIVLTTTGNTTITLPTALDGVSYTVLVNYGGAHSITFAGGGTIRWANGAAPNATSVANKMDKYVMTCISNYTLIQDGGRNF